MTTSMPFDSSVVALEYLQHVEAMQHQLQVATEAIMRNSLPDFEQSLWQQEMLTTCMRRNLAVLRGAPLDAALLRQLQAAVAALHRATCMYQGLIGQCSHTASLLRSLCTLHGQATPSTSGRLQTLCCEA